ncbi:hypothetical protein EDD22DRAFT_853240 [Suillus occidentalis]|nr:hypothetical protein EDD22DRAFT_853240 [Suillus occidentalis]
MTYYIAQGRAIRRMVILYTSLEDLINENDHRYESMHLMDEESMQEQNILQAGYLELAQALPWLHAKLGDLDHKECEDMLKKLKKGADAAQGDDTSTLKELVAGWLLCPSEWDWEQTCVKAGIRNRTTEYIISENSWLLFMYENYMVNRENLEEGFLKSKLLVLYSLIVIFIVCQPFFEVVPGPVTRHRVDKLLEWWNKAIFSLLLLGRFLVQIIARVRAKPIYIHDCPLQRIYLVQKRPEG